MTIFVRLGIQLAATPIYLSHWTAETFGKWLAIIATFHLVQIASLGHQNLLANDFLRLGRRRRKSIQRYLSSALPFTVLIGLLQLITIILVFFLLPELRGFTSHQRGPTDFFILVALHGFVSLCLSSPATLLTAALSPFGDYPRFAWWGALNQSVVAIAPVCAVTLGANLLHAGLAYHLSAVAITLLLLVDTRRRMRHHHLDLSAPNLRLGFRNFKRSLLLSSKGALELIRGHGIRLILAPLAGPAPLAAFASLRTGANLVLQGLSTVTNPLMPELMRFVTARDQLKTSSAFATVWLLLAAVLAPASIIILFVIPDIFVVWTRRQFDFEPWTFCLLSSGVLVFALSQPAIAVVRGNNLLLTQLAISATAGLAAILLMIVLVPTMNITGAAAALFAAETIALTAFVARASHWLAHRSMRWPWRMFLLVTASVVVTLAGMLGYCLIPSHTQFILGSTLAAQALLVYFYWQSLADQAKEYLFTSARNHRIATLLGRTRNA